MYEITSCQISSGKEDDKVVPYIDYNYSFGRILSPFSIVFIERGRGWEGIEEMMFPTEEEEKKYKHQGVFLITDSLFCFISSESQLFSYGIFFNWLF